VFICLTRIFKYLVAMDFFYKSCPETDLTTLHHVTFIELFGVLPIKALSFNSKQFTSNYNNKVFESKNNDSFLILEEHFFDAVVIYKKNYEVQFEDLPHEVVDFFHRCNISGNFFGHHKVYHKKLILIIFVLQMNILKDTSK
jgi:hypothetical protein